MPIKSNPAVSGREAVVAMRAARLESGEKKLAEINELKLPEIRLQLRLLGRTEEDDMERNRLKQEEANLLQEAKQIAETIEGSSITCQPTDKVVVGATVSFTFLKSGAEHILTLVSTNGSPTTTGTISTTSPVGAAMIGAGVGDEREANMPNGAVERLRITEICTD